MGNNRVKLAPSILAADFSRLGEQVAEVTGAGADYIHVDVMDGCFVPNITIGAQAVAAIRSWTSLPLDVHLMIAEPERHVAQFVEAGAGILTVHVETCSHLHRLIGVIKDSGIKAGVALNPATSLVLVDEVLPLLDLVLVMTVNPGFGGQSFIWEMLDKIGRLRQSLDNRGLGAELEVDGGITAEVAPKLAQAGADVLVCGSAVYNSRESVPEALHRMRQALD